MLAPFPAELIPLLALIAFILVVLRMRPRRFYIIRHGETILNAQHVRQGEEGALSESGRHQAETVGHYLKRFHIKCIISSTYERTRETSAIINTYLKVPVYYSELLVERRNPKEIIGKHRDSPEVVRIFSRKLRLTESPLFPSRGLLLDRRSDKRRKLDVCF